MLPEAPKAVLRRCGLREYSRCHGRDRDGVVFLKGCAGALKDLSGICSQLPVCQILEWRKLFPERFGGVCKYGIGPGLTEVVKYSVGLHTCSMH